MFGFFIVNQLISQNQFRFKPGDSFYQLLTKCINCLMKVLMTVVYFFHISQALDKVWHDGIIFKLKQNGISGNLLSLLSIFWRNRKQRVVLNGQTFSRADVSAGVPQGSILGPILLFLIHINDLVDGLSSNAKLFADTKLFADNTSFFLLLIVQILQQKK